MARCRNYLQTTSDVQRHFFYVGCWKSFQISLFPRLYQVVKGLLSSVLHGQTLGAVFSRGEGTETLLVKQGCLELSNGK